MRRRARLGIWLAAAFVLASCGSSDGDAETEDQTSVQQIATDEAEAVWSSMSQAERDEWCDRWGDATIQEMQSEFNAETAVALRRILDRSCPGTPAESGSTAPATTSSPPEGEDLADEALVVGSPIDPLPFVTIVPSASDLPEIGDIRVAGHRPELDNGSPSSLVDEEEMTPGRFQELVEEYEMEPLIRFSQVLLPSDDNRWYAIPDAGTTPLDECDRRFWVARWWVEQNFPDSAEPSSVVSTNAFMFPFQDDRDQYPPEGIADPAPAGFMAGTGCTLPAFGLGSGSDTTASGEYVIKVEYQNHIPLIEESTAPSGSASTPGVSSDALAELAELQGAIDYSDVSEGPCGSFAVILEPDRVTFNEWIDGRWIDRSDQLGPDGDALPQAVTTSDFTGDEVTEFLVEYESNDAGGAYRFGSIFYPTYGEGLFGDGSWGCEWGWSSFSSEYLGTPNPQILGSLRLEDDVLRATTLGFGGYVTDVTVGFNSDDNVFVVQYPPQSEGETTCGDYIYDDQLPIEVCSQGYSVELFQEALGLDADGYFGPGTQADLLDYQRSVGLPETGVIDAATWTALGVTANAPFPDLNGDGVVDGSEIPG